LFALNVNVLKILPYVDTGIEKGNLFVQNATHNSENGTVVLKGKNSIQKSGDITKKNL